MYPKTCGECGGAVSLSCAAVPVEIRGETIMVPNLEHGLCEGCGEVLLDLQGMEKLQKQAVKSSRMSKGLLAPDEVRALRHSLGRSQSAFEQLLGTGPKTVTRWEKGTVFQSATADRLMRLIRAMPEVVEVLEGEDNCVRSATLPTLTPRTSSGTTTRRRTARKAKAGT
jgi:HTH-type transcriptional regulator/antitoxin MqsA